MLTKEELKEKKAHFKEIMSAIDDVQLAATERPININKLISSRKVLMLLILKQLNVTSKEMGLEF